jgi:hypothetical protein
MIQPQFSKGGVIMTIAKSKDARNVKPKSVAKTNLPVTPEERYRMIAEAAYFRAEKRGFVGGDMAEDWLQAEAETERLLQQRQATEKGGLAVAETGISAKAQRGPS